MNQSTYIWSIIALTFLWLPAVPAAGQEASPVNHKQVIQAYGQLPLSFEANQGQTDKQVRFLARGPGYSLFLTAREAVLALAEDCARPAVSRPGPRRWGCSRQAVLRVGLAHASRASDPVGVDKLTGATNYFIGNDPTRWHTNVLTYAGVGYTGVYPGIDLVYHGNQGQLEYDFLVAPGGDPQAIELSFRGASKLSVNRAGDLVVRLGRGEVIEHAPAVYQEIGRQRHAVSGRYVLRGRTQVGFSVAAYDRSKPLVIDPTLAYSTYLGGRGLDAGFGITADASGNAYITGGTFSPNFPTTSGAFQTTYRGFPAFVSKLNAAGSGLVYSTYLGGSGDPFGDGEAGVNIAVDASGDAYVGGTTFSTDFPTTPGAFQTTVNGVSNAFVSKLNAVGSALLYSTYLGGVGREDIGGLAVDTAGNAYVAGTTDSFDFPTTPNAFQITLKGTTDAFVTRLNAAGSALVYSTYLGGSGDDGGGRIAIDASGNAYVTGRTGSSNFPTTPGALQTSATPPVSNIFVTKLNAAGSALVYSTFVGGCCGTGYGIAVDASGNAYVAGDTSSVNLPTTPGAFQTTFGGGTYDAFVSKLNAVGSALLYSTYLGGNSDDHAFGGIAIDTSGNAYVTGSTFSNNFPTTSGAFQTTFSGSGDAFVSKLNASGSALLVSTYLGGTGGDVGRSIAVDPSGNAYVTGFTDSSNFPTTEAAFQTTFGGFQDAFVSKFGPGIPFSSFSGKLELDLDAGSFELNGSFTLGPDGDINPPTEPVSLTIGTYSVTIPAGSFVEHKPGYAFEAVINGVSLEVLIKFGSTAGSYRFLAEGRGANLKGTTNPVTVTISIGNNTGTTKIHAEFE
jgi:hypothetical protein